MTFEVLLLPKGARKEEGIEEKQKKNGISRLSRFMSTEAEPDVNTLMAYMSLNSDSFTNRTSLSSPNDDITKQQEEGAHHP